MIKVFPRYPSLLEIYFCIIWTLLGQSYGGKGLKSFCISWICLQGKLQKVFTGLLGCRLETDYGED